MNDLYGILAQIAENRINEAQAKGEFENLPGSGMPLELEDLSHIPEELRMAYKILKNSGYLPPEIAQRKEAGNILEMLEKCDDEREKLRQMLKLRILAEKIGASFKDNAFLEAHDEYYQKILAKLDAPQGNKG